MTILYAPSLREDLDLLHANCLCTYDIQVLEILSSLKSQGGGHNKMLYFPHEKTPKKYNNVILQSLDYCSIAQIANLKEVKEAEILVTDTSNLALAFSLTFLKPSLIHLPAFTNIDFGDDKLYAMLQKIAFITTSLKELKHTLNTLENTKDSKITAIKEFLQGDLI
ncbi:hypothetical protein [Helicobacter sp.]|uniref:hypothetical protein n=1 Tax=Helicobacter sp. TaxID=218 RepID=UPI0025B956DB|nr:hypothetical protein [Helicobacter sp.]MCI5969118.1 hypothetical protein [Helicobacter sp.]MDY2584693.1 hypothetical protein [Helicobacter sp.]